LHFLSFFLYNGFCMIKILHNLFFPHEHNNHRPRFLHLSSLYFLVILVVFFQVGLSLVTHFYPNVLGFAANIAPEEIIRLTNEKRQSAGLAQLSVNPVLSQGAMQKGADMFAKDYWAHFAPDGTSPWAFFKSVGYNYVYAGENLARDFQNSHDVINAWMNSPTHRDNILGSNYSEIGVAVINGVLNNEETTLIVQFFGKPTATAQVAAVEPATKAVKVPEVAHAETSESVSEIVEEVEAEIEVKTTADEYEPIYDDGTVISPAQTQPTIGQTAVGGALLSLSSFDISKIFSLVLLGLLLIALAIDSILIVNKKVVRIGGKNLVHIAFILIILLIILITSAGRII
jgi:hypothetical protein